MTSRSTYTVWALNAGTGKLLVVLRKEMIKDNNIL